MSERFPSPAVPPSDRIRCRVRRRTRWSDEDNQSVLNNAVYLSLFEEARFDYFSAFGALKDGSFPFLLARTNIAFVRPGRAGVEVEIEIVTTHVGRTSLAQAYRVVDGEGAVWCEGEALLVFVDAGGSPTPISAELRDEVLRFEGSDGG